MLFRAENTSDFEVNIYASTIEQLNFIIDKVINENVSDMDCESPCSSTSMEFAELCSPGQTPSNKTDGENVEENDDTSSSDENEVNLPPGVCNVYDL